MNQKLDAICWEVQKALTGKQAIVEKVLMAMLCGGHILLDDVPGVGKTTLAVAFSKALGLRHCYAEPGRHSRYTAAPKRADGPLSGAAHDRLPRL